MVALYVALLAAALVAGTYGGLRFWRFEQDCDVALAGSVKPGRLPRGSGGNHGLESEGSAFSQPEAPDRFGRRAFALAPPRPVGEMPQKESR